LRAFSSRQLFTQFERSATMTIANAIRPARRSIGVRPDGWRGRRRGGRGPPPGRRIRERVVSLVGVSSKKSKSVSVPSSIMAEKPR